MAEELEALVERQAGVARLLEHALVEREPGQLAIEKEPRLRRLYVRGVARLYNLEMVGPPRQQIVRVGRIHTKYVV